MFVYVEKMDQRNPLIYGLVNITTFTFDKIHVIQHYISQIGLRVPLDLATPPAARV